MYCRNYILRLQIMSIVERFIILCPYLERSTIGGFTLCTKYVIIIIYYIFCNDMP